MSLPDHRPRRTWRPRPFFGSLQTRYFNVKWLLLSLRCAPILNERLSWSGRSVVNTWLICGRCVFGTWWSVCGWYVVGEQINLIEFFITASYFGMQRARFLVCSKPCACMSRSVRYCCYFPLWKSNSCACVCVESSFTVKWGLSCLRLCWDRFHCERTTSSCAKCLRWAQFHCEIRTLVFATV